MAADGGYPVPGDPSMAPFTAYADVARRARMAQLKAELLDLEANIPPPELRVLVPQNWTGPAPRREWAVDQWIPMRTVTSLYGDGGMGKSLLLQQLLTSSATCRPWLGCDVMPGHALGVFCEDDDEELERRQQDINAAYGIEPANLENLRLISRVGENNGLMTFDYGDVGELSPFWDQLNTYCAEWKPRILGMDTAADLYPANENERNKVRQFIQTALGRLARDHGCAVVLAAHPSAEGLRSGTGTGGSTAWNNSVRSRMYLTKPEGEDVSPDARLLSRKKANYAAREADIPIVWDRGAFRPLDAGESKSKLPDWDCIAGLLDMIDLAWKAGNPWSNASQTRANGRYLPSIAAKRFEGLSEKVAARMITEWLGEGHLEIQMSNSDTKTKGLRVIRRFDYGR